MEDYNELLKVRYDGGRVNYREYEYEAIEKYLERRAEEGLIFADKIGKIYYMKESRPMRLRYKVCTLDTEYSINDVYGSEPNMMECRDGSKAVRLDDLGAREDWENEINEHEWIQIYKDHTCRILASRRGRPKEIELPKKFLLEGYRKEMCKFIFLLLLGLVVTKGASSVLPDLFDNVFEGMNLFAMCLGALFVLICMAFRPIYLYLYNKYRLKRNKDVVMCSEGNSKANLIAQTVSIVMGILAMLTYKTMATYIFWCLAMLSALLIVFISLKPRMDVLNNKNLGRLVSMNYDVFLVFIRISFIIIVLTVALPQITERKDGEKFAYQSVTYDGVYEENEKPKERKITEYADIYHDKLPVQLEDFSLKIPNENGNNKEYYDEQSNLGKYENGIQEVYTAKDGTIYNLRYNVYRPRYEFLMDIIKNKIIEDSKSIDQEEFFLKDISSKEKSKWGALEVYADADKVDRLIIYDNDILEISFWMDDSKKKINIENVADIVKEKLRL